jgi:hypothetical protein
MAMETDAILRSILYQLKRAKTLKEAQHAVQAMCTKDMIAAVEQEILALDGEENKEK